MVILPVIGAFLEATGMILEKKILRFKKMNHINYTTFEFLAILIVMIPFMLFFWNMESDALKLRNLAILFFVVITAIFANLLIFYSLKREKVTEMEPIWIMQPLFVIVLAFILFPQERNFVHLLLALIASLALLFSHVKKHHLSFDKYILSAVLGSLLFAVELVASKPILQFYDPFTFYFVRCFLITLICLALFRPSPKGVSKKNLVTMFIIGIIWVLYRAIVYYGYESIGIIYTTTLFLLSPVLMFLFAIIFLKERPTFKQVITTAIIVLSVVLSTILN